MASSSVRWWRGALAFAAGFAVAALMLDLAVKPSGAPRRHCTSLMPHRLASQVSMGPAGWRPGVVLMRFVDCRPHTGRLLQDLGRLPALSRSQGRDARIVLNKDTGASAIHFDPAVPVGLVLNALRRDPQVAYAEADGLCQALYTPNDPYFDEPYDSSKGAIDQWWLRKIQAPVAWEALRKTTSNVRLAIIDTGVDYAHPDLTGVMARDAKGNLIGRSFVGSSLDPLDEHGHGTHCAGIAQADTDNGVGVAGVGFHSFSVVPARVLDANGSGDWEAISAAITWCADNGCRVESMSLGGGWYSQTMQDAINYAWSKGVVVVAAAGNSGSASPGYPAGCNHVVAVCATDANDQLARFSNYGPPVTIAAPGVDILSTMPTYPCTMTRHGLKANYDTLSGTSMACPVVAGAAAALIACQPALTSAGVVQRLQQTADNVSGATGGGWTGKFGYGRLNLDALIADRKRSAATGAIYGQVVDTNGVAVAGARVQCGSTSVTTRGDGMFRLAQFKPGSYTVAASQGKKSRRATVTVSIGADANLTMVL